MPELKIRLNKYISQCGVASRRKADELIEQGSVKINGKTTYELGVKVNPYSDRITVSGRLLKRETEGAYYMFNKPRGVLTSLKDPEGRPLVVDFFKKIKKRLFPVGRLDWDTEGLLLMTNDGDFAQAISHPKHKIPKTYMAKLDGQPTEDQLQKLRNGVTIVGGKVAAEKVERLNKGSSKKDWVKITVMEGKNRQIRRMFEKIGFDVVRLKRLSIGELKVGALRPGEYAPLTNAQIERIFKTKAEKTFEEQPKIRSTKKKKKTTKTQKRLR